MVSAKAGSWVKDAGPAAGRSAFRCSPCSSVHSFRMGAAGAAVVPAAWQHACIMKPQARRRHQSFPAVMIRHRAALQSRADRRQRPMQGSSWSRAWSAAVTRSARARSPASSASDTVDGRAADRVADGFGARGSSASWAVKACRQSGRRRSGIVTRRTRKRVVARSANRGENVLMEPAAGRRVQGWGNCSVACRLPVREAVARPIAIPPYKSVAGFGTRGGRPER